MSAKIISFAVMSGLLLAVAAPVIAIAGEPPKTKADCEKAKDMQWDEKTGTCIKK